MKIGICTSLEKAPLAVDAGFDYVELAVSEMCAREPWDQSVYAGLPIEACNLFFPSGVNLFDSPQFEWLPYMEKARTRLTELGVEIAVVGSGGQRSSKSSRYFLELVGEESRQVSREDVFATMMQAFMEVPGKTLVAPESLNRTETNTGNDCGKFARTLKSKGVGYTADSYHILFEWDANGREGGLSEQSKAFWEDQLPHAPLHVHLAQLEGRRFPQPNDPMLNGFFTRLFELGYDERVSLECNGFEPAEYKLAIENVRTYFK